MDGMEWISLDTMFFFFFDKITYKSDKISDLDPSSTNPAFHVQFFFDG